MTHKPRQPSHPLSVRAVWSSMMALGRFGACADLLFLRGVRASSVQISHPHPCLSRERVLGRLLAVYACAFWCVLVAQKARRAGQKKTSCRRAWQPGCRQKPPGCSSPAGAATTSSSSLPGMILWRGPIGRYPQKNGGFAWVWACYRVSTSLWEAWGLPS